MPLYYLRFYMLTIAIVLLIYTCYKQVIYTRVKAVNVMDIIKLRAEGPLKATDPNLIDFIRKIYLVPPSKTGYNLSKSWSYKMQAKALSWGFVHKYLESLFKDKPPGFFVEAGALDGEYLSNSLWLEKYKGWTGLLIEPDPTSFAALVKKNRKAWMANVGLSSVPYPTKSFFTVVDIYKKEFTTLDTFGMWAYKGHSFDTQNGIMVDDTSSFQQSYSSVQCFPLESLLLALNVTVVDFLSLDIQGREWDVLKLFPFDRIKVRTMVVEYYPDEDHREYNQEFVNYFQEKGFHLLEASFEPDYFFVNKDEKMLIQHKLNS